MSNFSSKTKYVEARPRREKKLGRGGSVISVAASSGGSGVSKSYVDSNFVTLATEQTISGAKDFVGGIKVNGMPITYNAVKKAWEFKGDVVVTGAITMFGSLSGFQPSTVTEAVEVDGETIVKTKNSQGQWQLTAIGGGSGSGGGISAAEVNILIENALKPYALSTSIPTDNKQLSNGAGYATVGDLDTRINNLINGAPAAYDTLKEIADVLAGNVNSIGDILTALDTKATKTYVDAELAKYVKLATAQPIEAQHNFVNGLQIGGLPITKSASANNTIYLDANLVVSGAITMFGSGSATFPTIWANIPFDLNTMEWTGSVWRVKGGGSGGLDTNAVNVLISKYLTQKSYATISDISSALVGYATQSWVGDNYLSKSGGTVNGYVKAKYFGFNSYQSGDMLGYLIPSEYELNTLYYANRDGYYNVVILDSIIADFALPITGGTVNGNVTLSRLYTTEGVVLTNTGDSYSGLIPNSRITSGGQDKDFWLYNSNGAINHYATSYAFEGGNASFRGTITASSFIGDLVAIGDTTADANLHVHGSTILSSNTIIGTLLNIGNSSSMLRILTPRADRFSWVSGRLAEYSDFSIEYNDGSQYGLYGSINYYTGDFAWQVGRSDGLDILRNLYLQPLGGNVAIGGTTADEKLHVHGNLLTTGVITTPQINIGGLAAYKLQDDTLFIDANVVVRGAISMFGVNTLSEMESIEQRLLSLEQKVEQLSA